MTAIEPITEVVRVTTTPERAFAIFPNGIGTWWPRAYTWSGDDLYMIAIEPLLGGFCFEKNNAQEVKPWGEVLVFDPSRKLAFTWGIEADRSPTPDPAAGSVVEVTFENEGEIYTRVTLTHRGFEAHIDGESYRDALAAPEGWPYLMDLYAKRANTWTPERP